MQGDLVTNLLGATVSFVQERRLLTGVVRAVHVSEYGYLMLTVEVDYKLFRVDATTATVITNG